MKGLTLVVWLDISGIRFLLLCAAPGYIRIVLIFYVFENRLSSEVNQSDECIQKYVIVYSKHFIYIFINNKIYINDVSWCGVSLKLKIFRIKQLFKMAAENE